MAERRPQRVPDAFVRAYVGAEKFWVLVRPGGGRRLRLDLADRILLDLADGTRGEADLGRDAERLLGRALPPRELDERLARLTDSGALADGSGGFEDLSADRPANLVRRRIGGEEAGSLAVRVLPGARFACDGRGACCRVHDRVPLTLADLHRLRAAWPEHETTPRGLTLESAVRTDPSAGLTLAARDGACVLLEADGRCGAAVRLGPGGKPAGCSSYPLRGVVVGGELHVALAIECRCAVDLARSGPPLEESARALTDGRHGEREVEELASEISATTAARWPRERYLSWRDHALAGAERAADPLRWALEAAAALSGDGPSPETIWPRLAPLRAQLGAHLAAEERDCTALYPAVDLQLQAFAWGAAAADRLGDAPPAGELPGERLAVAHRLFGHGLLRARSLSVGLVALALELALARAGGPPAPPALEAVSTAEYLFNHQALQIICDRNGGAIDAALTAG